MIITTLRKRSIAIAAMTYNQPTLMQLLADRLSPYLTVIDNGSDPSIVLSGSTPHEIIAVPSNRYFAGGWNYAMPFIHADWIAMLNDDITGISWKMIEELVDLAEENSFDVVSPTFNSPHAHMQPHKGQGNLRKVSSIDWVAAIIRKKAWDAVGGFNEKFPGYGSDLDISYRLQQQGYQLAVSDTHVINHVGGVAAVAGGTQHIQGNVQSMNDAFNELYGVRDWAEFTRKYLL